MLTPLAIGFTDNPWIVIGTVLGGFSGTVVARRGRPRRRRRRRSPKHLAAIPLAK